MEPLTISRSVRIAAPAERVWDHLATGTGLAEWLADEVDADLALVPGEAGRLTESGRARRLVVTEADDDTRLAFTWWSEDQPDDVSTVVISLDREGEATTVTVTETLDPQARLALGSIGIGSDTLTEATVADLVDATGWDLRLDRLAQVAPRAACPTLRA
ncbi:MAG: SRPBCC family protein [Acidimicrobiales bacterium]